jgi:hypothetical protein
MKSVTTLNLSYNRVTDAGIDELSKMKSLKSLNLRETSITQAGRDRLAKNLPQCTIQWSMGREK